MIELAKQRKNLDEDNWATQLVDLYLERTTEGELLNTLISGVTSQQQLTDRLCEAYFYLGKYHSARGNRGVASNYFKLALSTNVFEYVEHRYARLELNLLRDEANKPAAEELQTQ
jgi:lipoprotein NlpI